MADSNVIVKAQDMNEDIQAFIFQQAQEIMKSSKIEKDIASHIKKELDTKFGHTWHVIVGKNFGSYVTHEAGYFLYFYIGDLAFLIFKTG